MIEPKPDLDAALAAFAETVERCPEVVESFLGSLDSPRELVSVHVDRGTTAGAQQVRIRLEPSDRLLEFLAAGAGDLEDLPVQVK